ncbi:MAG: acyl transferase [Bacteroidetes bacterium]|nr:acyl transferase [Bacteroidota bacterium]
MELESIYAKIMQVTEQNFEALALEIFIYQSKNCVIYSQYLKHLQTDVTKVTNLKDIPYLPISFFKNFSITTNTFNPEKIFESSNTTGFITSKHCVKSAQWYEKICTKSFDFAFNNFQNYCHLALLPAYLERQNSSLVYQIDHFIQNSSFEESGFYLYNHDELHQQLIKNEKLEIKTILWGVTFALLDFIEKYQIPLKNTIIIETGGMKGRKKEMIRTELHSLLSKSFGIDKIGGEYGMTEIMSQAYSKGDGVYQCPPWMQLILTEINDPFTKVGFEKNGKINIIDLGNIDSCCFIATDDLGKCYQNNTFEVLGRIDNSDIRGCNLLV